MPIDIAERYKLIFAEHQHASSLRISLLRSWFLIYAALGASFAWTYQAAKEIDWIVSGVALIATLFMWGLDFRNRDATFGAHQVGKKIEEDSFSGIPQNQYFFARLEPTSLLRHFLTFSRLVDFMTIVMSVIFLSATVYLFCNQGKMR